jgi:hypothetical protein
MTSTTAFQAKQRDSLPESLEPTKLRSMKYLNHQTAGERRVNLWDMYKKALRLRTIRAVKLRGEMKNYDELIQEETALAVWFTSQYDAIRNRFAPFLRLIS